MKMTVPTLFYVEFNVAGMQRCSEKAKDGFLW